MTTVLLIIHFFIAAFLVGSILLQRSEGGALSGLGGGMGGLMTARGSANLLTRVTAVLATLFFASSLLIAILLRSPEGGRSILDVEDQKPLMEQTAPAEEEPSTEQTAPVEENKAPTAEGNKAPAAEEPKTTNQSAPEEKTDEEKKQQ